MLQREQLFIALSNYFNAQVIEADFEATSLQGGTVGHVQLITGTAEIATGEKKPYKIVLKTQKQWARYGDALSWRREYDLYQSDLGATFSQALRWPTCYYANMNDEQNEYELWLEYIDGVSGVDLTPELFEKAAFALGSYQGQLYAQQPECLQRLTNISGIETMKTNYWRYRSWPVVYDYIRSNDCALPLHLRQMLIDIDTQVEEIFASIEQLPRIFCHRDFWVTNILYTEGNFALIDWDTSGWGYLGEDIASLIVDETDVTYMMAYYERCVPAYYRGFSQHVALTVQQPFIYEMMLLKFGYRFIDGFLNADSVEEKQDFIERLQKIYDMKQVAFVD